MRNTQFIILCYLILGFSSCGTTNISTFSSNKLLSAQDPGGNSRYKPILHNQSTVCSTSCTDTDIDIVANKPIARQSYGEKKTINKDFIQRRKFVNFAVPILLKSAGNLINGPHTRTANFSKALSSKANVFPTLALAFLFLFLAMVILFFFTSYSASLFFLGILLLVGGFSLLGTLLFFILGLIFH